MRPPRRPQHFQSGHPHRLRVLGGLLIMVAACSDPPSASGPSGPTPALREIALLDSSQWGGGVVRARSAGFVPGLPLVFDGATLQLEGHMVCPGQCGNANFWSAGLAVDAAAGRIHVSYPGSPTPVITFDRLP